MNATDEYDRVDNSVYLPGADIQDNASLQIRYESGIVASLWVSFFGPKADDQETFELIGTEGRIILTRHTGVLDVVTDYGAKHEVIDCKKDDFGSSHFGADLELVRELRSFYDGAKPHVSARSGLEAARMISETGAEVLTIIATVDRQEGAAANVEQAGYRFESLFTASELVPV